MRISDWSSDVCSSDLTLTWDEFMALPQTTAHNDIHCVTTWSKFDNDWQGVSFQDLFALVKVKPEAKYVVFHSYGGYTTNVPLVEIQDPQNMLAQPHNRSDEHTSELQSLMPQH